MTIPDGIARQVQHAIDTLKDVQFQLEIGRNADRKYHGEGRYEYETWQAWKDRAESAQRTIDLFRQVAPKNGVDPDTLFRSWGIDQGIFEPGMSAHGIMYADDAA